MKFLVIFTAILFMFACSQEPWPEPSCRVKTNYISNHQGAGACIVRLNNRLLAMKLDNSLYDLPSSHSISPISAQCSAHNTLWLQTGLNVEVEDVVGLQADGTWLFGCHLEAGFDGSESAFMPSDTSRPEVEHIEFVDPFTLDMYDWDKPDQFIVVRDAFVAQGQHQSKLQKQKMQTN
ncbi:hypothetical protein ACOI22_07375 [Glaciecola sp. 2405UD65-10]|uniref:hypothetical protein n=1 Tax=Glaciecola sp. 2405UD65-10 TaxID=3397244 RepID=UPI003B5B03FB